MAVRTALLTSRNINLDTDFSKYIESVSTAGVITGFQVTASSVATGQAWVPCIRTNLETIYAFVQNYNSISISGDGYVIISIPQEIVDNWGGNEDGTGIATVEVVDTLPTKNYLLLATITGGVVEDNRYMIPKVDELKTDIDTINEQIQDLDVRVDALEQAGAIDHLEERALVWEKYALTDTLFKQLTPALDDSTVEAKVWDAAAEKEVHIQRQGSGTAANTLKLKVKKVGSPSNNLIVQVRKGIQVDVSSSEAYWYWDSENIIASGAITNSDITTSWQELEVTLDANFGGTEWELLDIVVMNWDSASVDASNYYVIACDSTQWSEGFSYVKVNWTTRSREKLMPYCVSGWFAQALLSKVANGTISISLWTFVERNDTVQPSKYNNYPNNGTEYLTYTVDKDFDFKIEWKVNYSVYSTSSNTPSNVRCTIWIFVNWEEKYKYQFWETTTGVWKDYTFNSGYISVKNGDVVTVKWWAAYYSSSNRTNELKLNSGNLHWRIEITKAPNYKWKPRSTAVKSIWSKESTTLFGVHSDRTRIDTLN